MKVVASSDWRDDLAFETPVIVAQVSPGEAARCSVCGGDSAPIPRTELWAIKHRHPKQHGGFVRFYCQAHLPAIKRQDPAPLPRAGAPKAERKPAQRRSAPVVERPRSLCPNCFVELPPSGSECGMCGTPVA